MADNQRHRLAEKYQPLGDTGDGDTGVPADEQGISNRPGDTDEDEKGEGGSQDGSEEQPRLNHEAEDLNTGKNVLGPNTTSKD